MIKQDKAYFIFLIFLGALSFFPLAKPTSFKLDESRSPLFEKFPYQFADWKGTDSPVDERTYEILETRNVLSRNYTDAKGHEVNLLLVGSRKDRRVAHPPEVCYLSSNFLIVDEAEGQVKIGSQEVPVKTFVAKNERNPADQENVLYLYKVGGRYTTNYYSQQMQFALDRMANRDSQVLLIRIAGSDSSVIANFLETILPVLS